LIGNLIKSHISIFLWSWIYFPHSLWKIMDTLLTIDTLLTVMVRILFTLLNIMLLLCLFILQFIRFWVTLLSSTQTQAQGFLTSYILSSFVDWLVSHSVHSHARTPSSHVYVCPPIFFSPFSISFCDQLWHQLSQRQLGRERRPTSQAPLLLRFFKSWTRLGTRRETSKFSILTLALWRAC